MSTRYPLRSYARGDLSRNWRGRSGDESVGAKLEHLGLPDVDVTRHRGGRVVVSVGDQVLLNVIVDDQGVRHEAP